MTKSGVTRIRWNRICSHQKLGLILMKLCLRWISQNAEKVNGRWAMVGFVALLGAYVTTGQIIPGIF